MATLELKDISKRFQVNGKPLDVLKSISLHGTEGKIICLLGKSGSGKTTLLNIICGLEKPNSGEASLQGTIGYIPQKDLLLPWRNVLKNVLLPLEIQKKVTVETISKSKQLLDSLELGLFKNSFPNEISGGMKQKVSYARGLINNPEIVLFDEPFSAIDFDARIRLGKEVRSNIVKNKKIGIFVTHNIEEAIAVGDKVIVLGGQPASIIFESDINIAEEQRGPTEIRKTLEFQRLFDLIWKVMN